MRVLVLVADYPNTEGGRALMYVHTRNLYYQKNNIEVVVLNFKAMNSYTIDGIKVITNKEYRKQKEKSYDILICHAANIRNHYIFLRMFQNNFSRIVFFFHGHEVLRLNSIYPEPYNYMKKSSLVNRFFQDVYDTVKLNLWRKYIPKLIMKSHLIFVSQWMYDQFRKWTKLDFSELDRITIIPNSAGSIFKNKQYKNNGQTKYDFITVRNYLDGSKYCIDLVNELAKRNTCYRFLVIGTGRFFDHNTKAENIEWINRSLSHAEIVSYLNQSKCALMPTRLDAQGLMMCEMATFGIPLITSDIQICHDMLDDFEYVWFINNDDINIDLAKIIRKCNERVTVKSMDKFYDENTSGIEVKVFNS